MDVLEKLSFLLKKCIHNSGMLVEKNTAAANLEGKFNILNKVSELILEGSTGKNCKIIDGLTEILEQLVESGNLSKRNMDYIYSYLAEYVNSISRESMETSECREEKEEERRGGEKRRKERVDRRIVKRSLQCLQILFTQKQQYNNIDSYFYFSPFNSGIIVNTQTHKWPFNKVYILLTIPISPKHISFSVFFCVFSFYACSSYFSVFFVLIFEGLCYCYVDAVRRFE